MHYLIFLWFKLWRETLDYGCIYSSDIESTSDSEKSLKIQSLTLNQKPTISFRLPLLSISTTFVFSWYNNSNNKISSSSKNCRKIIFLFFFLSYISFFSSIIEPQPTAHFIGFVVTITQTYFSPPPLLNNNKSKNRERERERESVMKRQYLKPKEDVV